MDRKINGQIECSGKKQVFPLSNTGNQPHVLAGERERVKENVCVVAVLSGLEWAALRKRQGAELEVGATRQDRIRNEDIRETERVRCFGDKGRVRWFGQRRDSQHVSGKTLLMLELKEETYRCMDRKTGRQIDRQIDRKLHCCNTRKT